MSIGAEEVFRLHAAVREADGLPPVTVSDGSVRALTGALEVAAMWPITEGPIEAAAQHGWAVIRSQAIGPGQLRTALLVIATILARSGTRHTSDWLAVAQTLADENIPRLEWIPTMVEVLRAPSNEEPLPR